MNGVQNRYGWTLDTRWVKSGVLCVECGCEQLVTKWIFVKGRVEYRWVTVRGKIDGSMCSRKVFVWALGKAKCGIL